MKPGRISFYFYGDPGPHDQYSPAYACNREQAAELVYILASHPPFTVSRVQLMAKLGTTASQLADVLTDLTLINAIEEQDGAYGLNFAVFLEQDMRLLDSCLIDVGQRLGSRLLEQQAALFAAIDRLSDRQRFSRERLLYHVLCDQVLDGTAFAFLTEQGVLVESRLQPGGRDYLIFGYEESEELTNKGDRLLCSSNNYRAGEFTFNSFGDSAGSRQDMFRFFRLIVRSLETATPFGAVNQAYIQVIEREHEKVARRCGELLQSLLHSGGQLGQLDEEERGLLGLLAELGYLAVTGDGVNASAQVVVPVFRDEDASVLSSITDIAMPAIFPLLLEVFEELQAKAQDLSALRHGVSMPELTNELWHQVFGRINQYLIETGLVERPKETLGEGRYLRSLQISRKNRP